MFDDIRDPHERVRAVCMYGCQVEVDPCIPPRRYFRSGMEMIRMANVYYDEREYEKAYILYSKFITLFVEKLPKHPEYKTAPPADKSNNKKKLLTIFRKAETVKKILTEQFRIEEEKRTERERKLAEEQRALEEQKRKQEEERKRLEEERKKNLSEQKWLEEEERLRREQEDKYRRLQDEELRKRQELAAAEAAAAAAAAAGGVGAATPAPPSYGSVYTPEGIINTSVATPSAPSAPPEVNRALKPATNDVGPPEINRATKPVDHFTSTGGTSSNLFGLRDMFVPAELMVKFLNIAQPNTNNNIETCGILCGKLSQDAFRITHLIVPKQRGTPDSCDTENEEELFDVQDKYDLITLGWIHTHPSQTAFLSSVDLHTHCSYQLMLPEAIAIVCSPKFNETGFFFLTPDHGLRFISSCKQQGFHPHPKEPPLFDTGPHAKIDTQSSVTVVDLRR